MFPQKTYEKMLKIIKLSWLYRDLFWYKFVEIDDLDNDDKKNRWFGYYQKQGEFLELWTLEEVREWIRNEIKERK